LRRLVPALTAPTVWNYRAGRTGSSPSPRTCFRAVCPCRSLSHLCRRHRRISLAIRASDDYSVTGARSCGSTGRSTADHAPVRRAAPRLPRQQPLPRRAGQDQNALGWSGRSGRVLYRPRNRSMAKPTGVACGPMRLLQDRAGAFRRFGSSGPVRRYIKRSRPGGVTALAPMRGRGNAIRCRGRSPHAARPDGVLFRWRDAPSSLTLGDRVLGIGADPHHRRCVRTRIDPGIDAVGDTRSRYRGRRRGAGYSAVPLEGFYVPPPRVLSMSPSLRRCFLGRVGPNVPCRENVSNAE
jgi:hypothetical protein